MRRLPEIEKGKKGWKKRKAENQILEVMDRATVPHCGYRVWQKLQRKTSFSGDDICILMRGLWKDGLLTHCGYDDGDSIYRLSLEREIRARQDFLLQQATQ